MSIGEQLTSGTIPMWAYQVGYAAAGTVVLTLTGLLWTDHQNHETEQKQQIERTATQVHELEKSSGVVIERLDQHSRTLTEIKVLLGEVLKEVRDAE